ncbi:MAG: hypothetical protein HY308_14870 [Gammaproteobacteria bacterium]|nr:hypothetical protein [Gammaproteobacteria bacterium]
MNLLQKIIAVCFVGATSLAWGADRLELPGARITGSQESPRAIYIIPWQSPSPTDLVGRPTSSLLDEVLAPVDRDVFRREVEYHSQLQARSTATPAE